MKHYIFLLISLIILNDLHAQTAVGSWTLLGPLDQPLRTAPDNGNGIGRVSRVKFHPTDSQTMYAVANQGGVFISKDRGLHWTVTPGTETMPKTRTACVCIDYTNDNILYLGTGDGDTKGGAAFGLWKSTNGGATFTQSSTGIGNKMVSEILMSPLDHNTLLAAVCNGNNPAGEAVYKSTDGGATWTQVLSLTKRPDDIQIKAGTNSTVIMTTGSNFYKSTDFGDTWTFIPLPAVPSTSYIVRIAQTVADTNIIYVGASTDRGYFLRSTDGGASFTSMYDGHQGCVVCYDTGISSGSQGEYDFTMAVNPKNSNELLMASENVFRSMDGGATWTEIQEAALAENLMWDYHSIQFNPYNWNEVFLACDGGVWSTVDSEKTIWRARNTGLCGLQTYRAAQHPLHRDIFTCATQDCGEEFYTGKGLWNYIGGGDMDGPHYFDYFPGYNMWSTYVDHRWQASDTAEIISTDIGIGIVTHSIYTSNIYMAFSQRVPYYALIGDDTLYITKNILAPTISWTNILNNPYQVRDMKFCANDSNIFYLLTKDTLYRSDNVLASTPTFIKLRIPTSSTVIGFIATSNNNSNRIYISSNAKMYESKDKGTTWTDITYNLPVGINIMGLVHDDYSPTDRLFVASATGVYYKDSAATTWTLIPGYPTITYINELTLYNDGTSASVLRTATFGRGVWECPINNDKKPLVANLKSDKQHICPGDTVHYSVNYYGQPTTITWSFPGGSPSSSTSPNPVVVYSTAGSYNAQVIVSNAAGADTVLKTVYISVSNTGGATLSEDFEKNIFPPANWLYPAPIDIYGWHITDKVGARGFSTHSLVFDNYDYDANGGHNNFITAPMDLTGKTKANVTFDVAYQYTYGYNDSLLVAASTDCGDSWTTLYSKGAPSMATTVQNPVLLSGAPAYVPPATQWRTDTVNLNTYLGKTVLLSFINVGHGGSTLYLDNINLGTKGVNVASVNNEAPAITLYPNPTTGILDINATGVAGEKIIISCYNILGSQVRQQQAAVSNSSVNTTIDLSAMPPGIYQVKLQDANGFMYTGKIVLQ